jgi:hypothetical protein
MGNKGFTADVIALGKGLRRATQYVKNRAGRESSKKRSLTGLRMDLLRHNQCVPNENNHAHKTVWR